MTSTAVDPGECCEDCAVELVFVSCSDEAIVRNGHWAGVSRSETRRCPSCRREYISSSKTE